MQLVHDAMESATVAALRAGGPDANGQPAERGAISDGKGVPCRHCLRDTPAGKEYLILAHRPFPAPQPYAETGPIFLCAGDCARSDGAGVPSIRASPSSMSARRATTASCFASAGRDPGAAPVRGRFPGLAAPAGEGAAQAASGGDIYGEVETERRFASGGAGPAAPYSGLEER